MASQLRRTWVLLTLALFAIAPVVAISMSRYVADVFPRCRGTLEASGREWPGRGGDPSTYVPLDVERGGVTFHLDTTEAANGQVTWARIVRNEKDSNGATCDCGGIVLRDQGVSNRGGSVWPQANGSYVYIDNTWNVEGSAFRLVERPTRHLQRTRLVERRHLPAMVALMALLALGVAALRARRGILYATKIHTWTEARLEPGGRIESESGEMLGMLAGGAPLVAGPVLLSPNEREKRDVYRELTILARSQVALGSHARWRDATIRGLREARVLAIVGVACSAVSLVTN